MHGPGRSEVISSKSFFDFRVDLSNFELSVFQNYQLHVWCLKNGDGSSDPELLGLTWWKSLTRLVSFLEAADSRRAAAPEGRLLPPRSLQTCHLRRREAVCGNQPDDDDDGDDGGGVS